MIICLILRLFGSFFSITSLLKASFGHIIIIIIFTLPSIVNADFNSAGLQF